MRYTFLITCLLLGCSRGEYWEFTNPPGLIQTVAEVENIQSVCGMPSLGCYQAGGAIWIKKGLSPAVRQCVISHEYHHAAGFTHPKFEEAGVALDCGDGTMA